jgi:hypothetical protein
VATGQALVTAVEDTENNRRVVFEVPDAKWMKYILPKVCADPHPRACSGAHRTAKARH